MLVTSIEGVPVKFSDLEEVPTKFPLNELVIELALIEPVTCKSFVVA